MSYDLGQGIYRPKGLYNDERPVEMTQINPVPVHSPGESDGANLPGIPVPIRPSTSFNSIGISKLASEEDLESQQISLHQAARDGRLDIVKRRVKKLGRHQAKKLNKKDEDDSTPLHYAIRYGHIDIATFLLDCGADVNIQGEDEATPLHYAARFRLGKSQRHREDGAEYFDVDKFILQDRFNSNDDTDGLAMTAGSETEEDEECEKTAKGKGQVSLSQIESEVEPESALIEYLVQKAADINLQDSYGSTPLHYATMKGNELAVEEIIGINGVDIDACDKGSMTPLHNACQQGNPIIVKLLIEAGADMLARDDKYLTPLHHACAEGKEYVAKLLFHFGEKKGGKKFLVEMLSSVDNEHQTPLHSAVENGHFQITKMCLQKGANVNDIRNNLETPLHLAATTGNLKICKLLLSWRADLECKNNHQETPLHRASIFNRKDVVEFLIKRGADIRCRDKDKFTPLLEAATAGHVDTIQCLIDNGADVRARDCNDKTSIFWAANENQVDALKILLSDKVTKSKNLIDIPDKYGNTPLHIAAEKGYILAVRILLEHGACMANNEDEYTPLHLAAMNGRTKTIKELLKIDTAIVNDEDEASNTALHLAALAGHTDAVEALIDAGAAIDARNANMWTPLDCAAANGFSRTAKLLLEEDAPVDPADRAKTTPLHLASKNGHVDMVKLLLSWGADISMRDAGGHNCLDMAVDNGNKDVAMEILQDENWVMAMRNCTFMGNGRVTTPMRKMICKMPEVAEQVLRNCTSISDKIPQESSDFFVNFDYEFLEDTYADWTTGSMDGDDTSSLGGVSAANSENASDNVSVQSFTSKNDAANRLKQFEKKKNHPLMLMVTFKRDKLLSHPLVMFLLQSKWNQFGLYVYYIKLLIYLLFLTFLTGYAVYFTEYAPLPVTVTRNVTGTNQTVEETICEDSFNKDSPLYKLWIEVGFVVILILAIFHMIMEIIQLANQHKDYLTFDNLLEWIVYILAVVYVTDDHSSTTSFWSGLYINRCDAIHKDIGGLAIFLAWMVLVLFVRKLPRFGIYVVMFTDVLITFTQFFVVYLLFLSAFGLGFFVLFKHHPEIVSFRTVAKSLVKTSVMMIGEFDFDDIFNDKDNPQTFVAWLLFVIFIIIMTLILMNLLIGLAVDDIKAVQDQAILTRQAMQVDLALDVEKSFPRTFRKKLSSTKDKIFLNKNKGWKKMIHTHPISADDIKSAMDPEKNLIEKVEHETTKIQEFTLHLKKRLKDLQSRTDNLESMVKAIVRHMDIEVDEELEKEGQ